LDEAVLKFSNKSIHNCSQAIAFSYYLRFLFLSTMKLSRFLVLTAMTVIVVVLLGQLAMALPPTADIPEEILRTEIITTARSPVDGKLLTAAEYAELQAKLQTAPTPKLDPKVRNTIFSLRIRKLLLKVFPFLDI
jgi:hypothetical protein